MNKQVNNLSHFLRRSKRFKRINTAFHHSLTLYKGKKNAAFAGHFFKLCAF